MHLYVYFFYTGIATFGPYLGYWLTLRHLTNQQIGFLFSIGPLLGLIIQPMWGMIGDRYGAQKMTLVICGLMAPLIAFGYRNGVGFPYYVATAVGLALFSAPMGPISDAMIVAHAKKHGQSYGGIRVLGSLSYAVAVSPIGILYGHLGVKTMFIVYLLVMLVVLCTVYPLERAKVNRGSLFHGVQQLLSNRSFLLFLALTLLVALGQQSYSVFYSVYLAHLGGHVSERIGILYAIAAATELPFFIFSSRWIEKYGFNIILAVAAFVGAIRWLVLSLEPSYTILLLNQLLNGVTYALFYAAGVNFAYEISPQNVKTTAQTVFTVVYLNIANLFASNGGGWLIDHRGFVPLYRLVSMASLAGSLGFIVLIWIMSKRQKHLKRAVSQ